MPWAKLDAGLMCYIDDTMISSEFIVFGGKFNGSFKVSTSFPGPSLLTIFKMADVREKTLVAAGHV